MPRLPKFRLPRLGLPRPSLPSLRLPHLRLPQLRLPFLKKKEPKRGGANRFQPIGEDEDLGGGGELEGPVGPAFFDEPKRSRATILLIVAWLVVLGGFGGVIGWLAWSGAPPAEMLTPLVSMALPGYTGASLSHDEAAALDAILAKQGLAPGAPGAPDSVGEPGALAPPAKTAEGAADPANPEAIPVTAPAPETAAPATKGLSPVPDAALVQQGPDGPLPIIGPNNRQPWQVYARPSDKADTRPRVAVVVSGLGVGYAATEAAIQKLPEGVTLSFGPYGKELPRWIDAARAAGHEVLLDLPMEPLNYPLHDPGPNALLTALKPEENIKRMEWLLSRFTGYVGVNNFMGSRFTSAPDTLKPVLGVLKKRGLMYVDPRPGDGRATQLATDLGVARAFGNIVLDDEPSRSAIEFRLARLEGMAKDNGFAMGIAAPYPVSIDSLGRWLAGLEAKGVVLVPVSAIANKQVLK